MPTMPTMPTKYEYKLGDKYEFTKASLDTFNEAYEGYEKLLSELIKDGKAFMKTCLHILIEHIESEIKKQQDWAKGKSEYKGEKLDVNFNALRKAAVDYIKIFLKDSYVTKEIIDSPRNKERQKILSDGISKTTKNKAYREHLKSWVPILTKKVLILCSDKTQKKEKAQQEIDQYLKDNPILNGAASSLDPLRGFYTPGIVIVAAAFTDTNTDIQPSVKEYRTHVLDPITRMIREHYKQILKKS